MSFCTPNLVYLAYSDTLADEYPRVDFSSLVEARIDLRVPPDQISVPEEMDMILTYRRKQIPVFNNLVHLNIMTFVDISWESLPALVKNCPKLETLVFEGFHLQHNTCPWWDTSTFLSSNSVTVLKILDLGGGAVGGEYSDEQIKQIQLILERMPNLKQLTIYYLTFNEEDVYELLAKFHGHPRVASSKCKIQVIDVKLRKEEARGKKGSKQNESKQISRKSKVVSASDASAELPASIQKRQGENNQTNMSEKFNPNEDAALKSVMMRGLNRSPPLSKELMMQRSFVQQIIREILIRLQDKSIAGLDARNHYRRRFSSTRRKIPRESPETSTIPAECTDYVKDYVLGKGYVTDLERVSEEASVFASTIDFFAGDGKDAWIFDID
ncbi:unnamed protein product [Brassica oleracea]